MKSRKLLLISMVIFGLLLGGAGILQTQASVVPVTARINPPMHSLEDPIPLYFMITLSGFPNPYDPADIDPDTILVGGVVGMASIEDWPKIGRKTFKFKVLGSELYNKVVMQRIWHLAPAPHTRVEVDLQVTGQFDGGATFEGTCILTVFTEKPELDPLPP